MITSEQPKTPGSQAEQDMLKAIVVPPDMEGVMKGEAERLAELAKKFGTDESDGSEAPRFSESAGQGAIEEP